jgi:hypothetical protein
MSGRATSRTFMAARQVCPNTNTPGPSAYSSRAGEYARHGSRSRGRENPARTARSGRRMTDDSGPGSRRLASADRTRITVSSSRACPTCAMLTRSCVRRYFAAHVDQEERDSCLGTRLRVRSNQAEHPVGEMTQRVPRFLTVDDIYVATPLRTGVERSEVRAGAGLGVPLAPLKGHELPNSPHWTGTRVMPLTSRSSAASRSLRTRLGWCVTSTCWTRDCSES